MAVWLNNLTESIEKKYGITNEEPKQRRQLNESVELNEGVELNEALSDLMPDWLKQRILTTKYRYYGNGGKSRRSDKELGIHRGWDINAKILALVLNQLMEEEREMSYTKTKTYGVSS